MMQHQSFSQSASPLNANFDHLSNIHHFHGINFGTIAQPSHNTCSSLNTSPMHQITRGISGLTTSSSNEPLDLTMESTVGGSDEMELGQWPPPNYFDMRPLNLSSNSGSAQQQQQRMLQSTPPTSPSNNLCIIQEEHLPTSSQYQACSAENAPHHHPQICLTDVQGSEITLVALSDSSHDSDDSLDTNNSNDTCSRRTASTVTTPSGATKGISMFHEFLIKEPSHDMPSITRGVGRKASLENEYNKQQSTVKIVEGEQYARRGSDKSLGFSDDSLSNDSNQSPAQEVSHSSGFKSTEEERLSPDSLSEGRASGDEYELPVPHECRNLDPPGILKVVKQKLVVNSKTPPNQCSDDTSAPNINLEYSSGLQVELKVCERSSDDKGGASTSAAANVNSSSSENASKGIIKLRRISGDSTEYGKLCQQLLTQLTV